MQDWLQDSDKSGYYAVESTSGHESLAKALLTELEEACEEKSNVPPFCLHSLPQHVRSAVVKKAHLDKNKLRHLGVTAEKLENWGSAFANAGEVAVASPWQTKRDQIAWLQFCVDVATAVLGPEHPSTLTSRSNLASCLHSMGDFAAARALLNSGDFFGAQTQIQENKLIQSLDVPFGREGLIRL